MKPDGEVTFTRHTVEIEICFKDGRECCEWCNLSFRNRKGHIACGITGEEMCSPGDTIGYYCPLRKEDGNG